MKHSNRKELEKEYWEELETRREEKKQRHMIGKKRRYEEEEPKKKKRSSCCISSIFILLFVLGVFSYFYVQFKEPVMKEWEKRKVQIEELQQKAEDVKGEGEDLLKDGEEMLDKIEETQKKVSALKQALLDAKLAFDSLTKQNDPDKTEAEVIKEEIVHEKQEDTVNENKYPEDYVPYWLYQMRESEPAHKVPDFRCEYFGESIYLALGGQTDCTDCLQDYIYKANGTFYCAASGGLNGDGDTNCPGLLGYIDQCYIWNGEKWEDTVIE